MYSPARPVVYVYMHGNTCVVGLVGVATTDQQQLYLKYCSISAGIRREAHMGSKRGKDR